MLFQKGYGGLFTRVRGRFQRVEEPLNAPLEPGSRLVHSPNSICRNRAKWPQYSEGVGRF
jgi:hypothetical protein